MKKLVVIISAGCVLIIGISLFRGLPDNKLNTDPELTGYYWSERSLFSSAAGAGEIAFHLMSPWLREWRSSWGATGSETERSLPGDERFDTLRWRYTRAITINAPRSEVWRWISQMGQGKGGFYSYEGLENLLGCKIHNATSINPDWQIQRAAEKFYLHPQSPPLTVSAVRQGYWFLLRADSEKDEGPVQTRGVNFMLTWLFYLQEINRNKTRLIVRGNYDYSPGLLANLAYGPCLIEPIAFVMEKKMLEGIKQRVEG